MKKKFSINLIVKKEITSPLIRRLKVILPIVSFSSLVIFIISFLISILFLNSNVSKFNLLKKQIETYEAKIASQKQKEGIYSLTIEELDTIDKILKNSKNFAPILSDIVEIETGGITLVDTLINDKSELSFSAAAENTDSLDNFVAFLLKKEEENIISDVRAQGIIRDHNGIYVLRISLKIEPSLLTWKE